MQTREMANTPPRSKTVKRPRYEQKFKLEYTTVASLNAYRSHVRAKVTRFVHCVDLTSASRTAVTGSANLKNCESTCLL